MKIQDIPQTGKLGLTVTWPARNGLVRRVLVPSSRAQATPRVLMGALIQSIFP
jgi:hypothetical protein